ncbi:muts domain V-domain-containing protein [Naematelia encephala]|uniref:DNA mismatch repair protein n=1 Tax=Naematelia encephala TaxID=71784 RepID=A0A1Y2BBQ6_9TREE|nr:muts domain V-domain-containing protein [Naematelia encephala]
MAKAKPEPVKDVKASKQSTLASFFGKPKAGPPPSVPRPPPSSSLAKPTASSSPASSQLRTPSSALASSPLNANGRVANGVLGNAIKRPGSPMKKSMVLDDSEDDLSPPPEPTRKVTMTEEVGVELDRMDVDVDEDTMVEVLETPVVQPRRAKRKVVYAESDDGDSAEEVMRPKNGNGRKARKSLKADSDSDDFIFDEADDIAFAAAVDDYEASVVSESPSMSDFSPAPRSKKQISKSKSKSSATSKNAPRKSLSSYAAGSSPSAGPSRPGPKPLAHQHGDEIEARRMGSGGRSQDSTSFLLTAAERKKIQAKEDKREGEDRYSFLKDVRDKEGRRPDEPDYDKRTIYIPETAWSEMTPFERQFWEIKQNHYDTVLFFQKGKFYELYEDDASIGAQQFDLKLTERVKMSMVGVPEQSFEFWAAKFLGAGYKVGKVEQAETMIGMEMRTRVETDKKAPKIVNRELAQVFTNGTIVDGTYLTSDEANHCVAIKEHCSVDDPNGVCTFGICVLDASTGEFNLSTFEDDGMRTRLGTYFRQIRPKELVHAKGNLSVLTTRALRNILPSNTQWQSFRQGSEFYEADVTISKLEDLFETEDDGTDTEKPKIPDAIAAMVDKPIAMEALGGMLFYLKSLNLDKDLVSQKNFNIYDPIREGKSLVLDGQTLSHMEVLLNNEGGTEGTLLELLQRCQTPFGKRLFRIWLTSPLRDAEAINERLDAVDDLLSHPTFSGDFTQLVKGIPDLERLISRLHAGSIKQRDFLKVVESFQSLQSGIERLASLASSFQSPSIRGLLRTSPDLGPLIAHIRAMFDVFADEKTMAITPTAGADEDCDTAEEEVSSIEAELEVLRKRAASTIKSSDVVYWHSAQGGKEIYQLQVAAGVKVPANWSKQSGTKNFTRYYTPDTLPVIRRLQEARETLGAAKKNFYKHLLAEFDKDRTEWLRCVKVIAELDCLCSLAKASSELQEPKCRPEFVDTPQAFVDFDDLRHATLSVRGDFIPNNVRLGGETPRTILLTGPNMAGKSTLLRMTAAGVIMAQIGCYVPAAKARMSTIDRIQTRMGAYDNMFASASTFKVELDECSRILHEAGPKSLVILDELGRGTSTYDGMAIAGAVLHHIATHTLPLTFFATHYGSLTDDYAYHPNISNMHMQTAVDDVMKRVVFLYKLIPGVAESSHGTHVARMAGVQTDVVIRADQVSAEFFRDFKAKLASRRRSALPLVAHADFVWLLKVVTGEIEADVRQGWRTAKVGEQMDIIRRAIGHYEDS